MGIFDELRVMFCAVWTGVVIVSGYNCQKWVCKRFRRIQEKDSIADLIYYAVCGVYIFYNMMSACDGVIRWYFFAGLVVGYTSGHIILCSFQKVMKNIGKKKQKP